MLVPAYLACVVFAGGVYVAWADDRTGNFVIFLGLFMRRRFRRGEWKSLRVIEPGPKTTERPAPA
jgi:hypothetical protein